jgi:hypothetical protein
MKNSESENESFAILGENCVKVIMDFKEQSMPIYFDGTNYFKMGNLKENPLPKHSEISSESQVS